MTKNERKDTRAGLSHATARQEPAELKQAEEEILAKAQSYLLIDAKRPMLWTVAGIREEKGEDGSRRWIIAVHVRYPTGQSGTTIHLLPVTPAERSSSSDRHTNAWEAIASFARGRRKRNGGHTHAAVDLTTAAAALSSCSALAALWNRHVREAGGTQVGRERLGAVEVAVNQPHMASARGQRCQAAQQVGVVGVAG